MEAAVDAVRWCDELVTQAYELLVRYPDLDEEALAGKLGCDRPALAAVLNRLTELALIQQRGGEQTEIVAASPVLAMQQLLVREQEQIRARHAALERSYLTLSSVWPGYLTGPAATSRQRGAVPLEDMAAVRRCLQEFAVSTKDEVMAFTPRVDHPAAADAAARPLERAVLARRVRMRTIYPHAVTGEPAALTEALDLVDAGAEVRTVVRLPMWLVVVDRAAAIVPRDPLTGEEGGLLLRHEGTVAALVALFESYWERGWQLRRSSRSTDRSETERMILRLLATGAKDEAVARQLGQSVRTVRRVVADLMAELGAASRFELAIRATARGLL